MRRAALFFLGAVLIGCAGTRAPLASRSTGSQVLSSARADAPQPFLSVPGAPSEVLPDSELDRAVQRALAQMLDCPTQLDATLRRLTTPFLPPKKIHEKMTTEEKAQCNSEGDARALARVKSALQALPAALEAEKVSAGPFLSARRALQTTQCEADLENQRKAYSSYFAAHREAILNDEGFYWDIVRVFKAGQQANLIGTIQDRGFSLQVGASATNEPSRLAVVAEEAPDGLVGEFGWVQTQFELNDQYGPGAIAIAQVAGDIRVHPLPLEPLPLRSIPVRINWERDWHTNVSTGDYGGTWRAGSGHRYCRHRLHIRSHNNVCANTIAVSADGIAISATIKSGSFVDRWRGWLRADGELTAIAASATDCQLARAECRSEYFEDSLVDRDVSCSVGPGSDETADGIRDLCFREGFGENEMCHYGVVRGDGRCMVDTIVPCN